MSGRLTQPKIDRYLHWLGGNDHFGMYGCIYDEKSNELLDELFALLEQIAPISENGARSLWLRAERGPIEDYGDPEDEVENGEYESEEQFIEEWKSWFPDEIAWYHFSAVHVKSEDYRAISLSHKIIIVQDGRRKPGGFPNEIPEFVQWLIDGVRECIDMLRQGTYNDYVAKNLPPQHRTGKIMRRDFWNVWPESRADFFKDITREEVAKFISLASQQTENYKGIEGRIPKMTANDFYGYCAMGYAANHYKGCEKEPKEQYYLHADGRDEGLGEIDPDSPEAFHTWLNDRNRHGGHPWEVCRGGNSTHVALNVMEDERGYWLYLAGDAWNRTIETVKFYLALTRARIPVYLAEAHMLADRLAEKEMIGIVPEGVIPAYCASWFPDEHIIDYINLPYEDRELFLPFCTWYEEKEISLLEKEEGKII